MIFHPTLSRFFMHITRNETQMHTSFQMYQCMTSLVNTNTGNVLFDDHCVLCIKKKVGKTTNLLGRFCINMSVGVTDYVFRLLKRFSHSNTWFAEEIVLKFQWHKYHAFWGFKSVCTSTLTISSGNRVRIQVHSPPATPFGMPTCHPYVTPALISMDRRTCQLTLWKHGTYPADHLHFNPYKFSNINTCLKSQ